MLNVLPRAKKQQIIEGRLYFRVKRLCMLALAITIIIDTGVIITEWQAKEWLKNIESTSTAMTGEEEAVIKDQLQNITANVTALENIQKEYINPLGIIEIIATNVPLETTQLHGLQINYTDGLISGNGITDNRSTLVEFQNHLASNPDLTNVVFPVGNLQDREHIPFTFEAEITPHEKSSNKK